MQQRLGNETNVQHKQAWTLLFKTNKTKHNHPPKHSKLFCYNLLSDFCSVCISYLIMLRNFFFSESYVTFSIRPSSACTKPRCYYKLPSASGEGRSSCQDAGLPAVGDLPPLLLLCWRRHCATLSISMLISWKL